MFKFFATPDSYRDSQIKMFFFATNYTNFHELIFLLQAYRN
jgi:hypothetical protein